MLFIKNKTRNKKAIYTSTKWRDLCLQKLQENDSFRTLFNQKNIVSIVQLMFALDSINNLNEIEKCIHKKDVKTLLKIRNEIPIDFDSIDYPLICIFEAKSSSNFFCIITTQDVNFSKLVVKKIIPIDTSLIDIFESYSLVFP